MVGVLINVILGGFSLRLWLGESDWEQIDDSDILVKGETMEAGVEPDSDYDT